MHVLLALATLLGLLGRLARKEQLDEVGLGGAKQLGVLHDDAILVLHEELGSSVGNLLRVAQASKSGRRWMSTTCGKTWVASIAHATLRSIPLP